MEEVPTEATQDGIWEEVGIVQRVGSEAADRSGLRRNHGPELTTETWPHASQVPDWPLGQASSHSKPSKFLFKFTMPYWDPVQH